MKSSVMAPSRARREMVGRRTLWEVVKPGPFGRAAGTNAGHLLIGVSPFASFVATPKTRVQIYALPGAPRTGTAAVTGQE